MRILAASTMQSTLQAEPANGVAAFMTVDLTAATNLLGRRLTLVGVGIGTAAYILLINLA